MEAIKASRRMGRRPRLSLLEQNEVVELVVAKMPVQAVAEAYEMNKSRIKEIYSIGIDHKRRYWGQIRTLLYDNNPTAA
jgi:predicted patatin/cPLA2 family phospholipase